MNASTATTENVPLVAGRWTCRPATTTAAFTVRSLVSTVRGTIPVQEAWIDVDHVGIPSTVSATLDLDGIHTGNDRRDRDLRKPGLLDIDNHRVISFAGGPARRTSEGGWEVPGRLSARGASVELMLEVTTSSATPGHLTVRGTTELDRGDLGVKAPAFLIGRKVSVVIDAVLAAPTTSATRTLS